MPKSPEIKGRPNPIEKPPPKPVKEATIRGLGRTAIKNAGR